MTHSGVGGKGGGKTTLPRANGRGKKSTFNSIRHCQTKTRRIAPPRSVLPMPEI
jgi:hypothetical protein